MPSNEITFICGIQKYNKLVDVIKCKLIDTVNKQVATRRERQGGRDNTGTGD